MFHISVVHPIKVSDKVIRYSRETRRKRKRKRKRKGRGKGGKDRESKEAEGNIHVSFSIIQIPSLIINERRCYLFTVGYVKL